MATMIVELVCVIPLKGEPAEYVPLCGICC
jgi:hypothetical protein